MLKLEKPTANFDDFSPLRFTPHPIIIRVFLFVFISTFHHFLSWYNNTGACKVQNLKWR